MPLEDRDLPARKDAHAATEARLVVWDALARLPEPQRIALVLVDLEDCRWRRWPWLGVPWAR